MTQELSWWPSTTEVRAGVTVLSVSYNTKELTAFLLWSLRRILDWQDLEIMVIDNGSTDGSNELLSYAEAAGICRLISNSANRQHGPALNQGLSWLAAHGPLSARVWILDSDCTVASSQALRSALDATQSAAIVGEPQWDPWHRVTSFGLYSLVIDPARVWRPGIGPFADDGDPCFPLLEAARLRGLPTATFPFTAEGHLIHRGRASLAAVLANDERSNPYFDWAVDHHEPHFNLVAGASEHWRSLLDRFHREVPDLSGKAFARSLRS
jgi:glycosyltransferase involved in cell wall biosynthesis